MATGPVARFLPAKVPADTRVSKSSLRRRLNKRPRYRGQIATFPDMIRQVRPGTRCLYEVSY